MPQNQEQFEKKQKAQISLEFKNMCGQLTLLLPLTGDIPAVRGFSWVRVGMMSIGDGHHKEVYRNPLRRNNLCCLVGLVYEILHVAVYVVLS